MNNNNSLSKKLRQGESLVGAFSNIHSPAIIEIMADLGMDFVILDAEHTTLSAESAQALIMSAESRGLGCMTRIGENHSQVIQKYLDAGSQGVVMPFVNSRDSAGQVVESVKYPPLGKRGCGPGRAAHWGLYPGGVAEYITNSNQETLIAVQLETEEAIQNYEEIYSVDPIDIIFLGPNDLSVSLGYPGQPKHPDVIETIKRLGKAAIQGGKIAGTIARDAQEVQEWQALGFQFLCTTTSHLFADGVRRYLPK